MKTCSKRFATVFLLGLAVLAIGIGLGCVSKGILFCAHPFLVSLRRLGSGTMAAGLVLWTRSCRRAGKKPALTPLFDILLVSGSLILIGGLVFYRSAWHPALSFAGLALNGAALATSILAQVFDPAFPCPVATRWPAGGADFARPMAPALERLFPLGYAQSRDDLTRIEGIGPKLQQILNQAGIISYLCLASRTSEELRLILDEYQVRAPVDLESWLAQARLAVQGDWEALSNMQKELARGRQPA
jgi:hypothetical protein